MGADAAVHGFAAYNKRDGYVPTLVGNWTEERALADKTGIHRLRTWTADMTQTRSSVFADNVHKDGKRGQSTLPRVLEMDEQYLSAEWLPTSRVVYQPPADRVGDLIQYQAQAAAGPREAREMAALFEKAKTMVPQPEPLPGQLHTIYRDEFTEHDMRGLSVGRTQMKNQDGGPVHRDPDFLAETKCMTRDVADRYAREAADTTEPALSTATLPGNAAVTIYSEKLAKHNYNATMYGTQPYGAATFGKHTNFTKQMGDYTKDPSYE